MPVILHILKSHLMAGAENHVFMLLRALARDECETHLLNLHDSELDNRYREAIDDLERVGVHVHQQDVPNKWNPRAVSTIKNFIGEIQPQIVHTHLPYADLFGALAARQMGVPVVVASRHHDYSFSWREELKYRAWYELANRLHDCTIAISNRVADLCVRKEKVHDLRVVLYGCEDQSVEQQQARRSITNEIGLDENSIIIGTVARLIHWKGHRFAVRALHQMKENGFEAPVRWLLIGDGPQRQPLERMVAKLGMEEEFFFLGYRGDVPELMAGMDLLVHPTTGEGFGLVLLEAMVQSTPILATRTGAIPEIVVNGKTGILVEPRDAEDLAEATAYLVAHSDKRKEMGQAGRRRYESNFSLEVMAEKIQNVYSSFFQTDQ